MDPTPNGVGLAAQTLDGATEFEVLYREHSRFLWTVLRRLGVADAELEDALQEVFVVVHRRLPQFEGRASLRTWLYAIAVRVALAHRRKAARRETAPLELVVGEPRTDDDPEQHAARHQASRILDELLDELDDDKRTVFVLSEIEGLSGPDIAKIVGAKTRTVYSRLRAAKTRFDASVRRLHARERIAGAEQLVRLGAREREVPAQTQRRAWAGIVAAVGQGSAPAAAVSSGLGLKAAAIVGLLAGIPIAGAIAWGGGEAAPPPQQVPVPRQARDQRAQVPPQARAERAQVPPQARDERRETAAVAATEPAAAEPTTEPPKRKNARHQPSARAEPQADALADETALLKSARAELKRGNLSGALGILDRHASRHPKGLLARERQSTRLTLLCKLRDTKAAERVAAGLGRKGPACP